MRRTTVGPPATTEEPVMLFTLGHGQHIVVDAPPAPALRVLDRAREADPMLHNNGVIPLGAVIDAPAVETLARRTDFVAAADTPVAPPPGGPFAYYFANAPTAPHTADAEARLDALAEAMVEDPGDPAAQDSGIPPVFTYFGQFIDHDITANTDRESAPSVIDSPDLTPLPRGQVMSQLLNLRNGALDLDSLYGDGPGQGEFSRKLAGLMRHPTFAGKMRLGIGTANDANRPPLPADPAADLLRLGRILGPDPVRQISEAELQALPPALKQAFVNPDGTPLIQRAIIGDARNDENLIVAQLHCAMLRFHNTVVDYGTSKGVPANEVFEWARRRVRWHYQWLIVNAYLPAVCDPFVVAKVRAARAPLYAAFHAQHAGATGRRMPLPLEFSVAAFRFGHSMVRAQYDHNRFFGRAEGGSTPFLPRAPFSLLFTFTGNGHPPMPDALHPPAILPSLPNNWIIEWARFVEKDAALADRSARKIDTHLSPPLADLTNEAAGVFKHLAKRNLRRGHLLNLPVAQDCIAAVNARYDGLVTPLDEATLTSGKTGDAIRDGGFATATPLWFYILKEAETLGGGRHLGPLGSVLVAETLIGLVIKDPKSYWHRLGPQGNRWRPEDGAKPGGHVVNSIPAFLRSAGMLA